MNEAMIYELRDQMKNAKPALEMAHYYGELHTFVDELNKQADATEMTIQYMLAPLVAVTSNYIISGEAKKYPKDVAEFAENIMGTIEYFGLHVDIQLTNPKDMTFFMIFFRNIVKNKQQFNIKYALV